MRSIRTLSYALALFAFAAAPVTRAQDAPAPGEIVEACIGAMEEITQRAADGQRQVAAATVNRMEALAADGAPDARLVAVAHRGVEKIRSIAGTARRALNVATRRCARVLDEVEAPEAFKEALAAARQAAGERLRLTTDRCGRVITDALGDLIGTSNRAAR